MGRVGFCKFPAVSPKICYFLRKSVTPKPFDFQSQSTNGNFSLSIFAYSSSDLTPSGNTRETANGKSRFCNFLQFPAKICYFLRKSVTPKPFDFQSQSTNSNFPKHATGRFHKTEDHDPSLHNNACNDLEMAQSSAGTVSCVYKSMTQMIEKISRLFGVTPLMLAHLWELRLCQSLWSSYHREGFRVQKVLLDIWTLNLQKFMMDLLCKDLGGVCVNPHALCGRGVWTPVFHRTKTKIPTFHCIQEDRQSGRSTHNT